MTERERRELARLLRCAADDELTPDESAALSERGDADDAARIAFDRSLRASVGRVMVEPSRAPRALRERVERAMLEEGARMDAERGVVGRVGPSKRLRHWPLAVAASVLICAMLVVATQRGGGAGSGQDFQVLLATFLETEHNGCADCSETFQRKLYTRELDAASELLEATVGGGAKAVDLIEFGYRFGGVGKCGVPGAGASVHLMYSPLDWVEGGASVSLFVQAFTSSRDIADGARRLLECRGKGRAPILMWRSGDLIYYVVSPSATARDTVGAAMGAPVGE